MISGFTYFPFEINRQREKPSERDWVRGANEGKRTKLSEAEWVERTKASEQRWAKLSERNERRQANEGERSWVSAANEGKRTKVSERMERSEKIDGNNRNEFIEK